MRELRGYVELLDKNDVKDLFEALSLCIEYIRMDLYIYNTGKYVTCLYDNNPERLLKTKGSTIHSIVRVSYFFEAFMEYASPELKVYYDGLTKEV